MKEKLKPMNVYKVGNKSTTSYNEWIGHIYSNSTMEDLKNELEESNKAYNELCDNIQYILDNNSIDKHIVEKIKKLIKK